MWRGGTSLPEGQARCRPCRRLPCGTVAAYRRGCRCARCKSAQAAEIKRYLADRKRRDGVDFRRQYDKPRASQPYSEAMRRRDAARRARKAGATVESFTHAEIYERDQWICGICHERVDQGLSYPDPLSPSLDHVKPLVHDGEHSRANTRLAHLVCNVRRGAATDEAAA